MKKRILLSLVSFFMMTTMWASLIEAYQMYLTAAANGKTYATAELTLNLKNRNAISAWDCTLTLPAGVTFQSAELLTARVPEGYDANFTTTVSEDGSVVTLHCDGEEGVGLTGTDGAVATIVVAVAGDATVGDCVITLTDVKISDTNNSIYNRTGEFTWTIEEGTSPVAKGDVNVDGEVTIADAVSVLNAMAGNEVAGDADVNGDGDVTIADFVTVLNIMAGIE